MIKKLLHWLWQRLFGKYSLVKGSGTGAKISENDSRDYVFSSDIDEKEEVDLRPYFGKVKNQLSTNACVSFALCALMEYWYEWSENTKMYDLSELFAWYYSRVDKKRNTGCIPRNALKTVQKMGVCFERQHPFTTGKGIYEAPDQKSKMTAGFIRMGVYERVFRVRWKKALSAGKPFMVCMRLKASFRKAKKYYDLNHLSGGSLGSHAMVAVGYKRKNGKNFLLLRNSWGRLWGWGGYCYVSFDVLKDYGHDFWSIVPPWYDALQSNQHKR